MLEEHDRIGLAPGLLVFGGAVLVRVDDRVALEAIAKRLDEAGLGVRSSLLDHLRSAQQDLAQIHPVDLDRFHVISTRLLVDVLHSGCRLDRRAHAIAVVDAKPHDRQLENLREVERLVEGADVGGAIAEHAEDHIFGLAIPDSPATTGGERKVAADDPVAAHEAQPGVEHVHRSAATVRGARLFSEELGHHRLGVDAASDGVAMLSVAGEDVVVGLEGLDAPDHCRLLAQVEVAVAADLGLGVLLLCALLEPADELHLTVKAQQEVAILLVELQRLRRDLLRGWGRLHRRHNGLIFLSAARRRFGGARSGVGRG